MPFGCASPASFGRSAPAGPPSRAAPGERRGSTFIACRPRATDDRQSLKPAAIPRRGCSRRSRGSARRGRRRPRTPAARVLRGPRRPRRALRRHCAGRTGGRMSRLRQIASRHASSRSCARPSAARAPPFSSHSPRLSSFPPRTSSMTAPRAALCPPRPVPTVREARPGTVPPDRIHGTKRGAERPGEPTR